MPRLSCLLGASCGHEIAQPVWGEGADQSYDQQVSGRPRDGGQSADEDHGYPVLDLIDDPVVNDPGAAYRLIAVEGVAGVGASVPR